MPQSNVDLPASRIADILRQEPWSRSKVSSLDVAQHMVSQQRNLLDYGAPITAGGFGTANAATMPLVAALPQAALVGGLGNVDVKVNHLAERMSVLLANLQRQCDGARQDWELELERLGAGFDVRISHLEGRLASVEDRQSSQERHEGDAIAAEVARLMTSTRAMVTEGFNEAQRHWHGQHSELRKNNDEQTRQLEELARHAEVHASCLRDTEETLREHHGKLKQQDAEFQSFAVQKLRPPWFGELEAAVAAAERRSGEHLKAAESHFGHLRMDMDGLRLRLEAVRDETLGAMETRLQQELDRLEAHGRPNNQAAPLGLETAQVRLEHHTRDLTRRVDDADAKAAAIKVRLDSHDSRFGTLGERAETVCQQALDGARKASMQQKEEILSEVDCQFRILRQRMEALGQLCEELSLREMRQTAAHRDMGLQCAAPDRGDRGYSREEVTFASERHGEAPRERYSERDREPAFGHERGYAGCPDASERRGEAPGERYSDRDREPAHVYERVHAGCPDAFERPAERPDYDTSGAAFDRGFFQGTRAGYFASEATLAAEPRRFEDEHGAYDRRPEERAVAARGAREPPGQRPERGAEAEWRLQ